MKKYILILFALLIFQKWDAITTYFNPPPLSDYAKMHDGKVVLYATAWCPFCKKTREFLKEKGIDYYEYDIEKSSEGHDQYKALGGRGIPVLLVNGVVIKGYDPDKIMKTLK